MSNNILISDQFQNYISNQVNSSSIKISIDIVIGFLMLYTYYTGNIELYTKIFKYSLVFFMSRYFLSLITNYKTDENKTYFQLNGYVGLFTILILTNSHFDFSVYTTGLLLISFTIFSSAIKTGYTSDNFLTLLVIYNILFFKI